MTSINTLLRQNPRNCAYGAPMGDHGYAHSYDRMRCERLRMVDGDYGPDGTYWGSGSQQHGYMFVCFNGANEEYKMACGFLKYYRARSRSDAVAQCLDDYPEIKFTRG